MARYKSFNHIYVIKKIKSPVFYQKGCTHEVSQLTKENKEYRQTAYLLFSSAKEAYRFVHRQMVMERRKQERLIESQVEQIEKLRVDMQKECNMSDVDTYRLR